MRNRLVKVLTATLISATMLTGLSTINTEAATKVSLNKKSVTITEGKSFTLKVKGISSKTTVKWSTSNKKVATVKKGKITAKKKGTAVVSAKFAYKKSGKKVNKTLKCKVTVKAKRVQATKTPKPTSTPRPTATPTVRPTNTVAPTATPTAVPTSTPTPEPTVEVTPTTIPVEVVTSETPVATVAPTATSSPAPTATPEPIEVPVHVHNYNARYEVIKESTCTEDGLIRMYCECGEVYERVICATHHHKTYSKTDSLVPTEETDGYFGYHCNDCGQDVTFSERTTFPALTDENYPLEGWVYEKHDYDYNSAFYRINHEVDHTHEKPYIVVTDYIGTAEHPALKDKYVIEGVEYDVEIQGRLNITSPTVQSLRIVGGTWVNPDRSVLGEKKIISYELGGLALYD